jgi:electron transport complex protein RnfG
MAEISVTRNGLTLAAIAAVCTALVAFTHRITDERIADNEQAWLEQSLLPALHGIEFDGNVGDAKLVIPAPHALPGSEDAVIYRVYRNGAPAAALFIVTARDGYSGPIRLLVGVDPNGAVTGVRVLAHRETPGLGDGIEASRSPWAEQFRGRSLGDPRIERWEIHRDGGDFDQLTGASVTPRAVVGAVRETLFFFEVNREIVFGAKQ